MTRQEINSASDGPVIGLLPVGLAAYWPQMPAARTAVEELTRQVQALLTGAAGARVIVPGLVDSSEKSAAAGLLFARERVDVIVLLAGTYSTSSLMLPAVLGHDVPVVIANVQSRSSLDYATVTTEGFISHSGVACLAEMAGVLTRARRRFDVVSGLSSDLRVARELAGHVQAASIHRKMRELRVGCIGHVYPGMIDFYVDRPKLQYQLGVICEEVEPDVLVGLMDSVSESEVSRIAARARDEFVVDPSVRDQDLEHGARVAGAFERLVAERNYGALAYYWEGTGAAQDLGGNSTLGLSLLTEDGIASAPEGDILTALLLKVMHWVAGASCITEFYFTDYVDDFVLMGHSAPANAAMAEERPVLRRLEMLHGKVGSGLSIDCRVRCGPVTAANLALTAEGDPKLLIARGTSVGGPIMQIGNQNSRITFARPLPEFFRSWALQGPTHHLGMGIGDLTGDLERVASYLGITSVVV